MWKKSFWMLAFCGAFCIFCGGNSYGGEASSVNAGKIGKDPREVRIGTYDNRAIAVAYAPSKFNPVAEKMKEYKKAKAAGDEKKCAELKAWGEGHQRQIHLQGFCAVPVDDLLSYVKDGLTKVAKEENLAMIVWRYDYAAENVEIVDVTDQIVALYNPSEKTLRFVDAVKRTSPLPVETVEKHGQDH